MAFAPLLCQCSCPTEMNDGTSFSHTATLSAWTWFEAETVLVVWMRAGPVLKPLCLISLSKTLFPLSTGSNRSRLALAQSKATC